MPFNLFRRQASKKAMKLDSTSTPTTSSSSKNCDENVDEMLQMVEREDSQRTSRPFLPHTFSKKRLPKKAPPNANAKHELEDATISSTTQHSYLSSSCPHYPSKTSLPLDLSLDEVIQQAIAKDEDNKAVSNQRYLQRSTSSSYVLSQREQSKKKSHHTIPTPPPRPTIVPKRSYRKAPSVARLPESRSFRNRLERSDSDEYRDYLVSELQRMGHKKAEEDDHDNDSYAQHSSFRRMPASRNGSYHHQYQYPRYPYANGTRQTPSYESTYPTIPQPGSAVHSYHMKEKHLQAKSIEIAPGISKSLRGAAETSEALQAGYAVKLACMVCGIPLQCIADCEMVLCPDCMVVSPNTHEYGPYGKLDGKQGVGLGLVME